MNIAIVLMKYNPYGGYERQAMMLAETLMDRGDTAMIFTARGAGDDHRAVQFKRVPILKGASWLKVLSFALFSRYLLKRASEQHDVIIAFDRTLCMNIYRAGNACHREWLRFRKEFFGIRDIISISLNPLHLVVNRIEKRIFARIQRNSGYVVTLSRQGMKQIQQHYSIDTDRFVVIPPAVDLARFSERYSQEYRRKQRAQLSIADDTLLLLHVGSGFRIKGLYSTINCLPLLLSKGYRAKLMVIGNDRKGQKRYEKLVRSLGLEDHVEFLGGVTDVGKYYAAADVFVLPSLFETFGVAFVEALSFGLPIIVGRGAGISESIRNEEYGLVIDVPADPERLCEFIERVVRTERMLEKSGQKEEVRKRRRELASMCSKESVMSRFIEVIERAYARQQSQN